MTSQTTPRPVYRISTTAGFELRTANAEDALKAVKEQLDRYGYPKADEWFADLAAHVRNFFPADWVNPWFYGHVSIEEVDYVEVATVAYLECAVWSSSDFPTDATEEEREGNPEPLDSLGYGVDDIANVGQGGYGEMAVAVEEFITANWQDVKALDPSQVGHDFWLTRNRHGVGFWDRGLGEIGTRLTEAAHAYGESNLYIGDDGQLYVV